MTFKDQLTPRPQWAYWRFQHTAVANMHTNLAKLEAVIGLVHEHVGKEVVHELCERWMFREIFAVLR